MTCVEAFINENYDKLREIAVRCVGQNGDDLLQDMCLDLVQCETDKYEAMCERGELIYYVQRWLYLCAYSKTTRYYYKYRKWKERLTFDYPLNAVGNMPDSYEELNHKEQLAAIEKLLESCYWFDAEIFRIYYLHNHSINTLTNATGIGRKTIQSSIKKTKAFIQAHEDEIKGAG